LIPVYNKTFSVKPLCMKNMLIFLSMLLLLILPACLSAQPFFDTHVPNKYVKENQFSDHQPDTVPPPSFSEIRNILPVPLWPKRPDIIKLYWRTWELAFGNIRKIDGSKGFITPYIDPAFNNDLFTEDCGFMVLFCRYGSRAFNFQQTLDNFYAKQHTDGFICRQLLGANGNDGFERFDPSSAGINIFPWAEWEYFCNIGDIDRLRMIFPVLLANYQWYKDYRSWPDGTYFSSGWGCGMDNQPRLPEGFNPAFSHGHMSWIDVTLQEIYAGKVLIKIAEILNRPNDVWSVRKEVADLTVFVISKMWDPRIAIYVDRYKDGSLSRVKTIGAYWALLADIVPENEMTRFLSHLSNKNEFDRHHRIPSLSADNPDYDPEGGYWRGAVWAMTNYSVLRGLTTVGADSLAFEIALNHLKNVTSVFNDTSIIWENYSPDYQRGSGRKNFVGEGGLTGTAILFEYVFGIRADVPQRTIVWDIRLTDEFGVDQYPFGINGIVSLHCQNRKNPAAEPNIKVNSNVPFTLKLIWTGGSKTIDVNADNAKKSSVKQF
jgi:hypothetical protein